MIAPPQEKALRIKLLRKQHEMLRCKDKMAAARGGVGSGKTTAWAIWLLDRIEEFPKANHVVIGADYEQLRRGFFQTFVAWLDKLGYEEGIDYHYRESPTPMVLFKRTGARLRSLSAKLAERIRSVEFQSVVLEEPPTWLNGENVYEIIIERLRHSEKSSTAYGDRLEPQLRMSFNPPPVTHWLYNLIEKVWAGLGYRCWRLSLRENVLLRGLAEYVRMLIGQIAPARIPSEIDGHWATVSTGVYAGFDAMKHTIEAQPNRQMPVGLPPFAVNPMKPLAWMLDFNIGWMCSVVGQWQEQPTVVRYEPRMPPAQPVKVITPAIPGWQAKILYLFEEIMLPNAGAGDAAREFVKRYGVIARKVGVELYGDPAGGGRAQAIDAAQAVRTAWQAVIRVLVENQIPFIWKVQSRSPAPLERVGMTRDQFESGDGIGLIMSAEKCPELVKDYNEVKWVPGKNDIDKRDKTEEGVKRTHLSDAAGYCMWFERQRARGVAIKLLNWKGR